MFKTIILYINSIFFTIQSNQFRVLTTRKGKAGHQHAIFRVRRADNSFRFDHFRRLSRHEAFLPLANMGRTMALLLLFSFTFRHSWVENRYLLTRRWLTEFRSEALLFILPPPTGTGDLSFLSNARQWRSAKDQPLPVFAIHCSDIIVTGWGN